MHVGKFLLVLLQEVVPSHLFSTMAISMQMGKKRPTGVSPMAVEDHQAASTVLAINV